MQYEVTISGERLAAMHDNDMNLYVTPGAEERPYWASSPNFRNDYGVLSVQDCLDQLSADAGYEVDIDDLRADEEGEAVYTFTYTTKEA